MLSENIKAARKNKGLSQEEFAVRLNVVRQTVSKWERGLSVPDSEMLISISEVLDVPVNVLLGTTITETTPEDLIVISEKLETINLQLAQRKIMTRKIFHWTFIILSILIVVALLVAIKAGSPYLSWDYSDPESAVAGTFLHGLEFVFVRIAPVALLGTVIGAVITRTK